MITNRQLEILLYLNDRSEEFCTAKEISTICNVSIRTIKNDIDIIHKMCKGLPCISFESIPSKGYRLVVQDKYEWDFILNKWKKELEKDKAYNDLNSRIRYILLDLVESQGVRKNRIMRKYAISESTLYLDLKEVRKILRKYNLIVTYDSVKGYCIKGSEMDKRKFLIGENLYSYVCTEYLGHSSFKEISYLKEKLVNIFFKYQYKISESLFESLLVHLMITFHRISMGYVLLEENSLIEKTYGLELKISNEIFKQCTNFDMYNLEEEIKYFAWNLKGKREYDSKCEISEAINAFISKALVLIKKEFAVDFTNSVDLKVALALHFVPLLSRIKSNTQLKNCLLSEIKQRFPFAFDIASYFSVLIEKDYYVQINEDEMAYFTLYFNYGLESIPFNTMGKKVLVISGLKNSETILLRHRINQWFNKKISVLDFVTPTDLNKVDVLRYDVLFTTDNDDKTGGAAIKIELFPTEKDFYKMNLAINGYDSVESIISKFSEKLFYILKNSK